MDERKKAPADRTLSSAGEDARASELVAPTPQTESSTYKLAYLDHDFMLRDELRPVRLQLELLKPELIQQQHGIKSTVVIFGSTRIPEPETARERLARAEEAARKNPSDEALRKAAAAARRIVGWSKYYDEARKLAALISSACQASSRCNFVVITGAGPGIMEAANRGAHDVGAKSIGMNIVLPFEQRPNPFVTPDLSFQFHYFALRKLHFMMRAKALVVFPGGFGTLDELFETLTLIQTKKVSPVPVLLFGKEYWDRVIHFEALVEEGTISPEDLDLIRYVETAEEAWAQIARHYDLPVDPAALPEDPGPGSP
jgi:uncharacterized protein (TIGR00730 family)